MGVLWNGPALEIRPPIRKQDLSPNDHPGQFFRRRLWCVTPENDHGDPTVGAVRDPEQRLVVVVEGDDLGPAEGAGF